VVSLFVMSALLGSMAACREQRAMTMRVILRK
jgi:hypothetical protein